MVSLAAMPNVITAVGALFRAAPAASTGSFLGTCFAYKDSGVLVTAAHCVGDLPPEEVVAVWAGPIVRRVAAIEKHGLADIAVLSVPRLESPIDCFTHALPYEQLGGDFYAIGFTELVPAGGPYLPMARLHKGYFQRFFDHENSFWGYHYGAGEMSIPSPGGLSGGPIFLPSAQQSVIAMVTENVHSATVLDSVEETSESGKEYKALHYAIVQFGVALMMAPVSGWLENQVSKGAA